MAEKWYFTLFKLMPWKTIAVVGMGCFIATEERRNTTRVYKRFCIGSLPKLRFVEFPAFRPELRRIYDEFCSGRGDKFGIIFGPPGCGKSYMVRALCNKHPQGVLYLEAQQSIDISQVFRESIGLTSTVIDFLMQRLNAQWYGRNTELSLICGYLEKAASKYKLMHGKVPVIFIDAADVLAKQDEKLFRDLVHFAKVNANDENLIVVFISSDATILPIVQSMPACANRSTFFSVGDLTDEDAMQYLKQNGLSEDSSRVLVDYVDGHIVDLSHCLLKIATIQ